ncbi:MAG TPA: HEAT repeat domain-containing protein [Candidatus Polarisedimenticolaceae bacterium]|nr:HEAT repeat domain-containing protein [Candidatus Polarisedimenticolaceae bacterium]
MRSFTPIVLSLSLAALNASGTPAGQHPCEPEERDRLAETVVLSCGGALRPEIEEDDEDDPTPECLDVVRGLHAPSGEVRLAVLEAIESYDVQVGQCRQAITAFEHFLLHEPDAFLVYSALNDPEPLVLPVHAPVFLDLLAHPSPEVRRAAAEHLREAEIDPASVERLLQALAEETDPWIRVALAQALPEEHASEARAALLSVMRRQEPGSVRALYTLADSSMPAGPLLEALRLNDRLRATAIDLLGARVEEPAVRGALEEMMKRGSAEYRVRAARVLLLDPDAPTADAWQAAVLDERLPVEDRAALVLEAGGVQGWRAIACDATRLDPRLSDEVDRFIDQPTLFSSARVHLVGTFDPDGPERDIEGWILPSPDQQSVRCAAQPYGKPRDARLPRGEAFEATHAFTQDGVTWLADARGECWIPAANLAIEEPEPDGDATLEEDVSLDVVDQLTAARAAGDLELFDPLEGFTGVRVRGASPERQALWRSGRVGVLQVLTAVEADAQRRASQRAQNR